MKRKSTLIFVICYLAYSTVYIARVNLTMASPGMMEAGMLTASQLGFMGSLFSVIYAFGRLYFGMLSDRTPPYIIVCTGLGLCAVSNVLVSIFPPFPGLLLLWSANALAQSMIWSSLICILPSIYDETTVAKRTPLLITSSSSGQIIGIVLSAFLIERFGLRWAFIVPGFLTFAGATSIFCLTRRIPAETEGKTEQHKSMFALIKSKDVQALVAPTAFHGAMKDNVTLWMTVYLLDKYGINIEQSAAYVLLIPAAGLGIRLLYQPAYKLCRSKELVVGCYAFAVCLLAAGLLCMNRLPIIVAVLSLCAIFAGISLTNVSFIGMFPLRFAHSGNTGSVSGLIDFCSYMGSGLFSALYGGLIDNYGYFPMFFSWVMFSVLSTFILLKLQKKLDLEQVQKVSVL